LPDNARFAPTTLTLFGNQPVSQATNIGHLILSLADYLSSSF
jgi:hypothetical protein